MPFTYHRKRRELRDFTSELSAIPGVGEKRKTRLLRQFGSIQKIATASVEELAPFVGRKTATEIVDHFARQRALAEGANAYTIDSLVEEAIACYREQFDLIVQDICANAGQGPAGRRNFPLPRQVAEILTNPNHAIWVIPTAEFQREQYSARTWARGVVKQCDNPELAFHNWMQRDIRFAKWIEAEVNTLDLGC